MLPPVLESRMGASLSPCCSTSYSAPSNAHEKTGEDGSNPWATFAPTYQTQRKLQTPPGIQTISVAVVMAF